MPDRPNNLFFIPHTHWDREWYLPFQRFRVHLVDLIDQILERFDADPEYLHFNLDAQTVTVEDFLAIRPEMESKIKFYAESRRLGIGPWYNQPDMWTSGELLVRNLVKGYRQAQKYGGGQKIGYLPDEFGHPSQMPQLMRLADIDNYIYYHGVGDEYDDPKFCYERYWAAPDGSTVLSYMLDHGYANAKNHPVDQDNFNSFVLFAYSWLPRSKSKQYFIGCGGDHYIPQIETPALIKGFQENEDLREELNGGTIKIARVDELIAAVKAAEDPNDPYPTFTGELRGSRPNFLQAGVISSRMPIKQMNALCWRKLCYLGEPLALWDWLHSTKDPKWEPFLETAWTYVLKNQPHDSICGCSVDPVHRDMEHRFENCEQIVDEVVLEIMQRILMRQATPPTGGFPLMVFNPHVHGGSQIFKVTLDPTGFHYETDVLTFGGLDLSKTYCIKNKDGKALPTTQRRYTYKDCQDVLEITWISDDIPGMGYGLFYLTEASTPVSTKPVGSLGPIETPWATITFHDDGTFALLDKRTHIAYPMLFYLEDQADGGDGYDFYAVPGDVPLTTMNRPARITVQPHELGATVFIDQTFPLPQKLNKDRTARVAETLFQPIHTRLEIWNHIPRIDFTTTLENKIMDHRLRAVFRTPICTKHVHAASIYDVVRRGIGIEGQATHPEKWAQKPVPTSHVTEFVDIFQENLGGMAMFNKGLPEYEARYWGESSIELIQTLFRSFRYEGGELPDRGHAGDYHPTPEAQLLRPLRFDYALYFHINDWVSDAIMTAANEFILPIGVFGGKIVIPGRGENQTDQFDRFTKNLPPTATLIQCSNKNLIFTVCKQSDEKNGIILRFYNTTPIIQSGILNLGFSWNRCEIVGILEQPLKSPGVEFTARGEKQMNLTVPLKRIVSLKLARD
jgi:hypothetical protein